MENKLDELFVNIRHTIFTLINQNHVDVNLLAFDLGISVEDFENYFSHRDNDFSFYLQTLNLVENWEG